MKKYTIRDLNRDFPTEESCLDWLRDYLYPDGITCPNCGEVTKHHRMKSRPSYSCDRCGHHEHPMAGTIFQDTRTPLRSWFHAVFLMASTRCGISAKQLEREIGVTYKTAWRMFKQIRTLLAEDVSDMGGTVEADETYIGGKRHGKAGAKRGRPGKGSHKVPVFGVVERGGRVMAVTVPNVRKATLMPHIEERVLPSTTIYTDELNSYHALARTGYQHRRVNHSERIYVSGDVHTNTIEGFWSLLKRSIGGTNHAVSSKYLQTYLDEYTYRYNHRRDATPMFVGMLQQVAKA
jgi:transposase-like protein